MVCLSIHCPLPPSPNVFLHYILSIRVSWFTLGKCCFTFVLKKSYCNRDKICSVTGLFTAAFDDQVEWLIVKGISNFADGNEPTADDWNPFASVMAASVVAKLLNDSAVFKRWPRPHYQGDDSLT